MKKIFKDYFTFTKKEGYIAIILLFAIAMFILLPYYFSVKKKQEKLDTKIAQLATTKLLTKDSVDNEDEKEYKPHYKNYNYNNTKNTNYTLTPFAFDPNTIDEVGWQKIGLPAKTIKTILNYRSKGGSFKIAEDIRKIWGLKKEDADILVPYITIAAKQQNNKFASNYSPKNYEKTAPTIIDINTATVEEFRRLPGVGNTAYKIVKYREKLGGFINLNQIKETYSLTDSVYNAMQPYLKFLPTEIQKININTASDFDLGKHPYISNDIAKAIAIYRKQHGNYAKIEDVRKIVFINQVMYQKFAPYITVE